MAGFDDSLVREYFELNGFLTRRPAKPSGGARGRGPEEPGDLQVINPRPRVGVEPPFQLFGADLAGLTAATVAIKGLTAGKSLTAAMLRRGDFLEFIRKEAVPAAKESFATASAPTPGEVTPARLLVLPGLPAQEPARSESIALLRAQGVDHVLTFRTILENLAQRAEGGAGESATLRLLRLLQAYDMVNAAQLELFGQPPSK